MTQVLGSQTSPVLDAHLGRQVRRFGLPSFGRRRRERQRFADLRGLRVETPIVYV
jgi:hypothetical protein